MGETREHLEANVEEYGPEAAGFDNNRHEVLQERRASPQPGEIFEFEMNRAQIGLILQLLMDAVVNGDYEYEVIVTGEKARATEIMKLLAEEVLDPMYRDDDDDD